MLGYFLYICPKGVSLGYAQKLVSVQAHNVYASAIQYFCAGHDPYRPLIRIPTIWRFSKYDRDGIGTSV